MKRLIAILATALLAAPVFADVGVSVDIGQPGFYGHIDIGDYPQPRVIYREPILVERGPSVRGPVYLRVPPGHAKHWSKHCREYNACGERVYFVQDDWYNREYVPRYQQRHSDHHDHDDHGHDDHGDRGNGKDKGRGNNR